jgi:DNA-binding NarL/FixJ family response regulator
MSNDGRVATRGTTSDRGQPARPPREPGVNGHPGHGRTGPTRSQRTSVGVCEEHEIVRAGLIALLTEDDSLEVGVGTPEQLATHELDVAIVSSRAARTVTFQCPIIVCSDDPETLSGRFDGNNVAALLPRSSLTATQLIAAVHAAAAGLRVHANRDGNGRTALDDRALQVLELMAEGCSTREIAARMHYSERTIKKLVTELEERLGTRTRAETVAQAVRRGLI